MSTLFALLMAEVGLRVRVQWRNGRTLQAALQEAPTVQPGEEAPLAALIRPSTNDRIVYELRPGRRGIEFQGASLRTNTLGFRGPDMAVDKPPGTIRILGLGDSVMFGWGVEEHETYLMLVRDQLARLHPDHGWEAVNTGVPGYNTGMEVETLRARCLALSPDIVVLGYVGNDLQLPGFVRVDEDAWSFQRCHLLDALLHGLSPGTTAWDDVLQPAQTFDQGLGGEADLLSAVPARYRDLVGAEAAWTAIRELVNMQETHGFALIAYVFQHNPGAAQIRLPVQMTRAALEKLDVPVARPEDVLADFLREEGLAGYDQGLFAVARDDPHPSALHHRLVARAILAVLESSGVLRDRIAGRAGEAPPGQTGEGD